jgi:hypothetical protein
MKNETQLELARLIKEFKGEIKENEKDIKNSIAWGDYGPCVQLEAVNGALDYVIDRLKKISDTKPAKSA